MSTSTTPSSSAASRKLREEANRIMRLLEASKRAVLWEKTYRKEHPWRIRAQGFRDAADWLDGTTAPNPSNP